MNGFTYTIISTFVISLMSLFGAVFLFIKKDVLQNFLLLLVSLSAGTLMGGALLHLIPESANKLEIDVVNQIVIVAFVAFFLLEKILQWHHHHEYINEKHTIGYMNLSGDIIHNFLDGLIIAASFYTSTNLGITTVVAVLLHEIPQELGDFGVLVHSGFSQRKALISNLLVSLTSVIGGAVGYIWVSSTIAATPYITAFAAGGFLYMATSDLLPEIREEKNITKSMASFLVFLLGIGIMLISKE